MSRNIHVHFLPDRLSEAGLMGATAVVIDVLRATTTIVTALAAGASRLVPVSGPDEARAICDRLSAEEARPLLGGERNCVRIEGFDLGNSPSEYTPERVSGRTILFTTTNGTRALAACADASRVLVAAFVNLSAVERAVAGEANLHLVCAGTRGSITREDVLLAGALADRLLAGAAEAISLNDEAEIAVACWRQVARQRPLRALATEELAAELARCRGGIDLAQVGLGRDLLDAATIDRFDLAPRFDRDSGDIRAR